MVVILKPDHVRDVDLFVERYGARAYGPYLFWPHNIPKTELEGIEPGSELPGGLVALYDGRGRNETPLWLPDQRALVFADALTERDGKLLVWGTPWHEERVLPALRALLELPFEHVIVSHGEPVHDRAAFERALELPPWAGQALRCRQRWRCFDFAAALGGSGFGGGSCSASQRPASSSGSRPT